MQTKMNRWVRREWVANRADPTQVVVWSLKTRWASVKLVASWGIESTLTVGRRNWWAYDARWATRVFAFLEARWEHEQAAYDEDPMGRLSDYK